MDVKHLIFLIFIFNEAVAQSEPSVQDAIAVLPPSLQGKVDEKQIDELKNKSSIVFKEKCEKNGGVDAYPRVEKAMQELPKCIQSLVNINVLQEEVEVAKTNGRVDEVFKKYCDKTPAFKHCISDVLNASEPCFTPSEQKNLKTVHNVTEQLAEFVCYKNGDRIALFIAEGGPECIQKKQEEIQSCFNKTMGNQFGDVDINNMSSIPTIAELSFGEEECNQFEQLQLCLINVLEGCEQPTTANVVDSLIRFIRSATPCKNFPLLSEKNPDAASGLVSSLALLAIASVLALY